MYCYADNAASQETRKKYWEFMALDRSRFQNRISRVEQCLQEVLSENHRKHIFATRFSLPAALEF
ncbi:hypothetical protein B4U79_00662 [Dinothrombium tinctorium]|uniref:Uncharacterized protein n=1 Tax=Dinothrombium tinctorium TaxID=1965070 RepID=A0A443QA18_9ACAR|nr:hypothetical protein B4U79_00662 [Dinothrombium tinctorium]